VKPEILEKDLGSILSKDLRKDKPTTHQANHVIVAGARGEIGAYGSGIPISMRLA